MSAFRAIQQVHFWDRACRLRPLCYITLYTCKGRGMMTDDVVRFEQRLREFEKQPVSRSVLKCLQTSWRATRYLLRTHSSYEFFLSFLSSALKTIGECVCVFMFVWCWFLIKIYDMLLWSCYKTEDTEIFLNKSVRIELWAYEMLLLYIKVPL